MELILTNNYFHYGLIRLIYIFILSTGWEESEKIIHNYFTMFVLLTNSPHLIIITNN